MWASLGLGRAVAQEVTEALLTAAHNRSLPPAVQRDAGFILGRVGWMPHDLDAFVDDSRRAVLVWRRETQES